MRVMRYEFPGFDDALIVDDLLAEKKIILKCVINNDCSMMMYLLINFTFFGCLVRAPFPVGFLKGALPFLCPASKIDNNR